MIIYGLFEFVYNCACVCMCICVWPEVTHITQPSLTQSVQEIVRITQAISVTASASNPYKSFDPAETLNN